MIQIIGRSSGSDVVIPDPTISGMHAQLIVDEMGDVYINDLNSTNGTFVNDQRISGSVKLFKGDKLRLGKANFLWEHHIQDLASPKEVVGSIGQGVPVSDHPKKGARNWVLFLVSFLIIAGAAAIFFWINERQTAQGVSKGGTAEDKNGSNGSQNENSNENSTQSKTEVTYDLSCMKDDGDLGTVDVINTGSEIQDEMINVLGPEVTPAEEMQAGEMAKEDFSRSPGLRSNDRLQRILNRLVSKLGPSPYSYEIYEVRIDEINAFTIGAKIFVATGMLNFVRSDDELAGVIGHEIYHNELGHIKKKLQIDRTARGTLGDDFGQMATEMHGFFTTPFNQKDEAYCDLHGIDLVLKAGYDPCGTVGIWERMASMEGDFNVGENMLRSHPFGEKRMQCSHHHLQSNYQQSCD